MISLSPKAYEVLLKTIKSPPPVSEAMKKLYEETSETIYDDKLTITTGMNRFHVGNGGRFISLVGPWIVYPDEEPSDLMDSFGSDVHYLDAYTVALQLEADNKAFFGISDNPLLSVYIAYAKYMKSLSK